MQKGNDMAKDPAVLFYYQDFLVGTAFFTKEQKGCYIEILCHLYDKDTLPEYHMKNICGSVETWNAIKDKFIKDPANGELYNKRAREEKEKRVKFSESRRKNRLSKESDDQMSLTYDKDMKKTSSTSDEHMENENEDEDVNEINHENGVDRNTPEGIMFRSWGKQSNSLTMADRGYLEKISKTAEHDIDLIRYAFVQSVKYGKKNWSYVEKIILNKLEERGKLKAKEREIESKQKKIQEHKDFKPDPETASMLKGIVQSFDKKNVVDPGDHTKSESYQKSKKEMEREVKNGST